MKNNIRQYAPLTLLLCVYSIFILGCKEQSKPTVIKVVQKELFEKLFDLSTLDNTLMTTMIHSVPSEVRSKFLDNLVISQTVSVGLDTTTISYKNYLPRSNKTIYRIVYYRVQDSGTDCSILIGYPTHSNTWDSAGAKGFYILITKKWGDTVASYSVKSNIPPSALTLIVKVPVYQYTYYSSSTIILDYSHSILERDLFFRKIKVNEQTFENLLPDIIKCD